MSPPDVPDDHEKLEAALASPLFVDAFFTALQADENDEAVYGWMAEECGDQSETVERPEVPQAGKVD